MANPQQDEKTLARELRRAGVLTHPERLAKLAEQAWRDFPGERDEGKRRKVVSDRLRVAELWTLIETWRPDILGQAVGWLLAEHMPESYREAIQERQREVRGTIEIIPPAERKVVRIQEQRMRRAEQLERTFIKTLSKLDTVLVYGRPIGDCTVADVKVWADQREAEGREAIRDVRFARSLIANLAGNERIRDWWKQPEEVDQIYALSETRGRDQPLLLDPPD
jgi:hypothetical protein